MKLVSDQKVVHIPVIEAQRFYGDYLAASQPQEQMTIVNYFQKSINMSNDLQKHVGKDHLIPGIDVDKFVAKNKMKSYESLARCSPLQLSMFSILIFKQFFSDADRRYQNISSLISSHEFKRKEDRIKLNQDKLEQMKQPRTSASCRDEMKTKSILIKSTDFEKKECESARAMRDNHLSMAVENYVKCVLMEVATNHLYLFRLFALITENKANGPVMGILDEYIKDIPSYKFLEIMPQLTTYLSLGEDKFSRLISSIVGN